MAETLIVEILDQSGEPCGPGETGRVVITDFTNFATPLIRYEIGDYAEVGGRHCGRWLPLLQRILGRHRNLMVLPDGRRQWPSPGHGRFRAIAPVLQFQIIQTARNVIEAHFVVSRSPTTDEEAALREAILSGLGHPFTAIMKYHDTPLPRSAGGKFEEFICKVAD